MIGVDVKFRVEVVLKAHDFTKLPHELLREHILAHAADHMQDSTKLCVILKCSDVRVFGQEKVGGR